MNKQSFFLGCLLCFLSVGCGMLKPASTKTGKNLYETFFVGEEGVQYFIKPLTFENLEEEQLNIDMTFRYKNEVKGKSDIKMFVLSDKVYKKMDSLLINNGQTQKIIKEVDFMFSEKTKKGFQSRFSTKISLADLQELFKGADWTIEAHQGNQKNTFKTSLRTQKAINKLDEVIFVMF